jgi:hypothetical protein
MAIEIVDFPSYKMVDLCIVMLVCQWVICRFFHVVPMFLEVKYHETVFGGSLILIGLNSSPKLTMNKRKWPSSKLTQMWKTHHLCPHLHVFSEGNHGFFISVHMFSPMDIRPEITTEIRQGLGTNSSRKSSVCVRTSKSRDIKSSTCLFFWFLDDFREIWWFT